MTAAQSPFWGLCPSCCLRHKMTHMAGPAQAEGEKRERAGSWGSLSEGLPAFCPGDGRRRHWGDERRVPNRLQCGCQALKPRLCASFIVHCYGLSCVPPNSH